MHPPRFQSRFKSINAFEGFSTTLNNRCPEQFSVVAYVHTWRKHDMDRIGIYRDCWNYFVQFVFRSSLFRQDDRLTETCSNVVRRYYVMDEVFLANEVFLWIGRSSAAVIDVTNANDYARALMGFDRKSAYESCIVSTKSVINATLT